MAGFLSWPSWWWATFTVSRLPLRCLSLRVQNAEHRVLFLGQRPKPILSPNIPGSLLQDLVSPKIPILGQHRKSRLRVPKIPYSQTKQIMDLNLKGLNQPSGVQTLEKGTCPLTISLASPSLLGAADTAQQPPTSLTWLRASHEGPLSDSAGSLENTAFRRFKAPFLSKLWCGPKKSLKSRIFVVAVDMGESGEEFRFVLCNLNIHVLCLPSLGEWAMLGSAESC